MTGRNLIDSFEDVKVAVLGDVILDSYLEGHSSRLAQEAPVPVVSVGEKRDMPGGAANTAANLADLGARVTMLSVAGDDADWRLLSKALRRSRVDISRVVLTSKRLTIAKRRVVSSSQILVRVDEGSVDDIGGEEERELLARLEQAWRECDALVVSDYCYGVVTPGVIAALKRLQKRGGTIMTVDSRRLGAYKDVKPTAVKPNYTECMRLLDVRQLEPPADRVAQVRRLGPKLLEATGASIAAVTLDIDGALIFQPDQPTYRTYAQPRPGSRANGAGDTFVSAMTLALAKGTGAQAAAEMASTAAGVVVGQDRTTTCSAAALKEAFSSSEKVLPRERLAARSEFHRKSGKTVVFTNGCFDILHRGHIAYLEKAKALGDVLIVAVNSDDSVRRLKGPDRPVNPLDDRMHVLASLGCVDHVVPFSEDTPVDVIRAVKPNVFVKGGDYLGKDVPEAPVVEELGGQVRILPYIENTSTTLLIERIRKAHERQRQTVEAIGG